MLEHLLLSSNYTKNRARIARSDAWGAPPLMPLKNTVIAERTRPRPTTRGGRPPGLHHARTPPIPRFRSRAKTATIDGKL